MFDIKYLPWTAIKGQVLADLVAEFTEGAEGGENKEHDRAGKEVMVILASSSPYWELYVDGAANQKGSGIGIFMISPEHITITKSLRLNFFATNNEAKYEALLAGLSSVTKLGERGLVKVFYDSRLVMRQVQGEFEANDLRMQWYLGKRKQLQACFGNFTIDTSLKQYLSRLNEQSSTEVEFVKIYKIRISRFDFRLMLTCMCRVSFLTTLDIYKAYFKGCYIGRTHAKSDQAPYSLRKKLLCFLCLRVL